MTTFLHHHVRVAAIVMMVVSMLISPSSSWVVGHCSWTVPPSGDRPPRTSASRAGIHRASRPRHQGDGSNLLTASASFSYRVVPYNEHRYQSRLYLSGEDFEEGAREGSSAGEETGPRSTYIPPDFTILDDDGGGDSSGYQEPVSSSRRGAGKSSAVLRGPPRRRASSSDRSSSVATELSNDDESNNYMPQEGSEEAGNFPQMEDRIGDDNESGDDWASSKGTGRASWMDRNEVYQSQTPSFDEERSTRRPMSNDRRFSQDRNRGGSRGERRSSSSRSNTDANDRFSGRPNRSFREDFQGTRVFVQGLPPDATWQEVKDHFKVAGSVVFASVSVDSATGQSKGHGVVQYETTDMAQNAISVMRNYPLNGYNLFVREDVQSRPSGDADGSYNKPRSPPNRFGRTNDYENDRGFNRRESRPFREEMGATRVFVTGLPPDVTWQEVKDHFRLAGNVVFASVAADRETGESKGHGVVQYETAVMARNAIETMKDYPLNGYNLFVREDLAKPKTDFADTMPKAQNRFTPPASWECADEENSVFLSEEERFAILNLLRARDDARRRQQYDASDNIRDELKEQYGVHIDDRLKQWWTSVDGKFVPDKIKEIKGEGRWGNMKAWRQIPTTPENDACVNPDLVEGLLKQRDIARREKDFATADKLLEQARTSPDGDLYLRIHDESRTWRIWTDDPPPRSSSGFSRGNERKSPAEQCMDLVAEFAPEKADEVRNLLEKFPGREYAILKKLQQRYDSKS